MVTKTKIAFRAKKKSRQALAAIKAVRLPGRSSPKSIHLGYVSLDGGLSNARIDELDARLQEAWLELKGYGDIVIDREDARMKWARATGDEDDDGSPIDRSSTPGGGGGGAADSNRDARLHHWMQKAYPDLLPTAEKIVRSRSDVGLEAEDLVQDTVLRVMRRWQWHGEWQWQDFAHFKATLYVVMKHTWIDRIRYSNTRLAMRSPSERIDREHPDRDLRTSLEDAEEVAVALGKLDTTEAEIVSHVLLSRMSEAEIASLFNISRKKLYATKKKLRSMIERGRARP